MLSLLFESKKKSNFFKEPQFNKILRKSTKAIIYIRGCKYTMYRLQQRLHGVLHHLN